MTETRQPNTSVTMSSIAQMAGVSRATVSAVVNGTTKKVRISKDTQKRVKRAIDILGYQPHNVGRALATGKSYLIAVLVNDFADSFMPNCIEAIEDTAETHGCSVIVITTRQEPQRQAIALERALAKQVDGLIIATPCPITPQACETIICRNLPVVYLAHTPDAPIPNSSTININAQEVGMLAMQHLLELGHRHIACVNATPGLRTGISKAAKEVDATEIEYWPIDYADKNPMQDTSNRWENATKRPTAIFVNGDALACELMNSLLRRKITIPQDVSIVGVDNAPQAAQALIPLTTVHQPKYRQGLAASQALFNMIDKADYNNIDLTPKLIIRNSTSSPPAVP